MRKAISSIIILAATVTTNGKAANYVYVKLSSESDITVNITLKKQDGVGWANITTSDGTKRAEFLAGAANRDGGDTLMFASRGIAFNISYTADRKFTLNMMSGANGQYSCNPV